MKIQSIEPTPSPNAMKCNLDQSLPKGTSFRVSSQDDTGAPPHLKHLLAIEGVKSIFQVADFISIERYPKADWQKILSAVGEVFGQEGLSFESESDESGSFGEIEVFIQKLKGIPMQVKLVQGDVEKRLSLPDRFTKAVMKAQQGTSNLVFERKWVGQTVRYGEIEEVGNQIVEEISAAYDDSRLEKLVNQALNPDEYKKAEKKFTAEEVRIALQLDDWKERYAALEQYEPNLDEIQVLALALKDKKPAIRRLAVVYLGLLESQKSIPYLIQALDDRSPIVRRTAGDSLSDLGDPEAIPAMCSALQDENKLVRWRAARFLYEVGDETAIPALKEAIHDTEFEVRMQAQIALERIEKGEEASGTVWQQMTSRRNK